MKTKKIIIAASVIMGIAALPSCKKDKKEEPPATPPLTYGTAVVKIINDTVDFSTTSGCSDWSKGMDFDSIHTDIYTASDYALQSMNTNCVFTNNRRLTFSAFNNCKLFLSDALDGSVKKFTQGQTINYKAVANSGSSSGGVDARILEEGVTSSFNLNETFYLGLAFLRNGKYYNGWVKVKTLNNYYSCILVSYGVCKTADAVITAE